jgi:hypothetical protein
MVHKFKDYDVLYADNKAKTMTNIGKLHGKIDPNEWLNKKSWHEFMPKWEVLEYSQSAVQNAVYHASDAEDWQKFRVGLKGLMTEAKLFCLGWYYTMQPTVVRHIRVTNYLGALVRGGQLDNKLRIVR